MSSTNASGTLPRAWWTDNLLIEVVRERILDRVDRGMSDQQIARDVGVSSKTVQRFRAARSLPANAVNQYGPTTGAPARASRRKSSDYPKEKSHE